MIGSSSFELSIILYNPIFQFYGGDGGETNSAHPMC